MNRLGTAAVVGLLAGLGLAYPVGDGGQDVPVATVEVSPDGRTLVLTGPGLVEITVRETATEVRLRLHEPGLPLSFGSDASEVHLRAPLGDRTLVDASTGASRPAPHRPAWLPATFQLSGLVYRLTGQTELTYVSGDGVVLTVVEADVPTPPGGYVVTAAGHTYTVSSMAYGYGRLSPADLRAIGDSIH